MTSNIIKTIENRYIKKDKIKNIKIGDFVTINSIISKKLKRKQTFTGVLIAIKRKGISSTFTLRNTISKTVIDNSYKIYSNLIVNRNINESKHTFNRSKIYFFIPKKTII
uniref:Ribosomal protein L19 n=1 Tax=Malawimonas californiana TaxID=221722 RepID=A0A0B5GMV8_MALCL|nr:ribosomal protein L19 [Malawimonas californiana]AJF22883.1 ribosomal protein L19 [Malawimonas californiana]